MHILTFRLSVFGEFKQFTPTAPNMIAWTQNLQNAGHNYLPSIFQQPQHVINILNTSVQIGSNDKRIQFISQSGDAAIRILSERVDIEFTQGAMNSTEKYFDDKIKEASDVMKIIMNSLGEVQGTRLAYYVDALIPETNEKTFTTFYKKYNLGLSMNNPTDECVEWSHRFNRRISLNFCDKHELSNAILVMESGALQTIDAATGEQKGSKGLHIISDINTLAENVEERFNINDFESFIKIAQTVFTDLLTQVKSKLLN